MHSLWIVYVLHHLAALDNIPFIHIISPTCFHLVTLTSTWGIVIVIPIVIDLYLLHIVWMTLVCFTYLVFWIV